MNGVFCVGGHKSLSCWTPCIIDQCSVIKTQLKHDIFPHNVFLVFLHYADKDWT